MKTASTGSLTVLAAAAILMAIIWAEPGAADSIGSVYNMDKMLAEPHPLADQYGTRWQPRPASAPAYAPGAAPSPFPSPQPGTAPEPPPTTFPPPEPPPPGQTAPPAPQPAPRPLPVAKVTPVESPAEPAPAPLVMAPRLSIDAEGVDLEPEKVKKAVSEEAGPEKKFEQPGPRPPLPPG